MLIYHIGIYLSPIDHYQNILILYMYGLSWSRFVASGYTPWWHSFSFVISGTNFWSFSTYILGGNSGEKKWQACNPFLSSMYILITTSWAAFGCIQIPCSAYRSAEVSIDLDACNWIQMLPFLTPTILQLNEILLSRQNTQGFLNPWYTRNE